MTYPTAEQLTSWADTLTRTNWTQLATRLTHAIERDRRGGSAIPDGHPTTTMAGSGGVNELTSVEAAVHARTTARDEHHDRTINAIGYLGDVMRALAACTTQLDRIEARAHHDTGLEPGCSHHAQHGLREERYRGDLCRCCYDVKAQYGVLPPFKLLDDRARGIRWTTSSIAQAIDEARARR